MRKIFLAILIIILGFDIFAGNLYAADNQIQIPRAQLDESETAFTNAYVYFLNRDYWNAQTFLEQALSLNTYLVDYYLMTALTLDREGGGINAFSALASFLEVRPLDSSAPLISLSMSEQDNILDSILNTAPFRMSWRLARTDVQNLWDTGYRRPLSITGMGKIKSLGELVCISDTFGGRVYIRPGLRGKNPLQVFAGYERPFREVIVPEPVITLPKGDNSFYIFCNFGEVYTFQNLNALEDPVSPDLIGKLPAKIITDAEMLSSRYFAVSDPAQRNIVFYRTSDLEPTYIWSPPDNPNELLFEPVALERYADWLAIADRANGRVYVFNITSHEYFVIRDLYKPRDLLWSPLGELFVLTEDGGIKDFIIDFGTRTFAENNLNQPEQWDNLEGIWAFFHSPNGELRCMDIGASGIVNGHMYPDKQGSLGFLSLYRPALSVENENRESFIINGTFSTPFIDYMRRSRPVAQAAWNNKSMRANVNWLPKGNFDGLLIYRTLPRGQAVPLSLRPASVRDGSEVRAVISANWLLHRETLTNIVVDSSINFTMTELKSLLRFCLLNGLELDILATELPPLALTRASGFTGGKIIYGLHSDPELSAPQTHLQIQIPLPVELSSSGYPGRSMLAVYLDSGLIQSRAWMPLWPDLFEQ